MITAQLISKSAAIPKDVSLFFDDLEPRGALPKDVSLFFDDFEPRGALCRYVMSRVTATTTLYATGIAGMPYLMQLSVSRALRSARSLIPNNATSS